MRRLVTLFGGDDFSRRGEDVRVRSGREGRRTAGRCVIDARYGQGVARGLRKKARCARGCEMPIDASGWLLGSGHGAKSTHGVQESN